MTSAFKELLPRLVAAYHRGQLVPFLGAGMSRLACPSWEQLVADLETHAGATHVPEGTGKESLIRRANHIVGRIARRRPGELADVLRRVIYRDVDPGSTAVPPQTAALEAIWWPLVISTNYDDLFTRAYVASQGASPFHDDRGHAGLTLAGGTQAGAADAVLQVMGRDRDQVQHVLDSLTVTTASILWAIHGYLPSRTGTPLDHLASQLVVGHDEYRRISHAEMHYRRAFTEVWRRRSFLFLGSSLADPYLLDLFSEVQEFHGANPQPHWALVDDASEVDEDFLRSRFNIIVVRYGRYDALAAHLVALADAIRQAGSRQVTWQYGVGAASSTSRQPQATVAIRAEPLPTSLGDGEGMIVSSGLLSALPDDAPNVYLSPGIAATVRQVAPRFLHDAGSGRLRRLEPGVFVLDAERGSTSPDARVPHDASDRIAALRPWRTRWQRDLTLVRPQLVAALDWAASRGLHRVHTALIGSGTSRHFPAAVALSAMVRAWADWHRAGPARRLDLVLHVVDAGALLELTSGRLDVAELLTIQQLRVWVEFEPETIAAAGVHAHAPREPLLVDEEETIGDVMARLALEEDWRLRLVPTPLPDDPPLALRDVRDRTLRDLGVMAGACCGSCSLAPVIGGRDRAAACAARGAITLPGRHTAPAPARRRRPGARARSVIAPNRDRSALGPVENRAIACSSSVNRSIGKLGRLPRNRWSPRSWRAGAPT